ncbi:MAG: hypothetical protein RL701_3587 [Pseudomonadota bacterium]|jgi:hypothetical protein
MKPAARVLYVGWQDPETRRILPVARVTCDANNAYEFAYIRAVYEAQTLGFLPLLSFPDLERVYRSREMLPLLHNRLMQSNRPDYADYLGQLGLAADSAEPFTVLGRSGGRRATDTLELFNPPGPVSGAERTLSCVVLARGVRHLADAESAIALLQAGSKLQVTPDKTNAFNPKALKLAVRSTVIGYLPDYLVTELNCAAEQIDVVVRKVNLPPAPVHHRLLLDVTFPLPDPPPFSGPKYQPVSAEASSHAA